MEWFVFFLLVGVELFVESEGEVICVGGREGCRFVESGGYVRELFWRMEGNML